MTDTAFGSLGRYVRCRQRKDGTHEVFMAVPPRLRPEGWPATIALPQGGRRLGRHTLDNPAYLDAVRWEAERLNRELDDLRRTHAVIQRVDRRNVAEMCDLYLETRRFRALSESRKSRTRWNIRTIIAWAERNGDRSVDQITKREIERFLAAYDDRPFQQLDLRSCLNMLFAEAVANGWCPFNPCAALKWTAPRPSERDIWLWDDVDRFERAAEDIGHPAIGVYIRIQMLLGQRPADLRDCTWDNFDGRVFRIVQGKTKKKVVIPVPMEVGGWLERVRVPGSEFLFTNPRTGGRYTKGMFGQLFREMKHIVLKEGGPNLTLQALRHSAVCQMVYANLHPYKIAAITGHANITVNNIVRRYAIDTNSFAAQAMQELYRYHGGDDSEFEDLPTLGWERRGAGYVDPFLRRQRRAIEHLALEAPGDCLAA